MVLGGFGGSGKGDDVATLIAKKNYSRAIEVIREQLGKQRNDPRLRLQLGDVLVAAGKVKEAVTILLPLADEFAKDGFAAKAISVLKKVQKLEPGRRDIDSRLANLIEQKQRLATVIAPAPSGGALEIGMELGFDAEPASRRSPRARGPRARAAPPPPPAPRRPPEPAATPAAAPFAARPPGRRRRARDPARSRARAGPVGSGEPERRERAAPCAGERRGGVRPRHRRRARAGGSAGGPRAGGGGGAPRARAGRSGAHPLRRPRSRNRSWTRTSSRESSSRSSRWSSPSPTGRARAGGVVRSDVRQPLRGRALLRPRERIPGTGRRRDGRSAPDAPPGGAQIVVSPLFKDFSVEELVAVIGGLNLITFERGNVILREGEPGNSLFMLTSGTVKAFVKRDGKQVPIAELEEGAFFGEVSILTGKPRSATIVAKEHCELLELDRHDPRRDHPDPSPRPGRAPGVREPADAPEVVGTPGGAPPRERAPSPAA